jgi:hypothetical protein
MGHSSSISLVLLTCQYQIRTVILYNNGTFLAFVSSCQVEIVGPIPTATEREWIKLNILSEVCGARHFFCDNPINIAIGIAALAEGGFCDLTLLQTKVGLLFQ